MLPRPQGGPCRFSDVTAMAAGLPGHLDAQPDPALKIGGKLNSRYLLAMPGRAAAPISAHAQN
jgi:hypothetical protein